MIFEIHHYYHSDAAVGGMLGKIFGIVLGTERKVSKMLVWVQELVNVLNEQQSLMESLIEVVDRMADRVMGADDLAALQTEMVDARANVQKIAEAIRRNTPAETLPEEPPVPPVEEPPVEP